MALSEGHPTHTHRMGIGFPMDESCVLITVDKRGVRSSFRDDSHRRRAQTVRNARTGREAGPLLSRPISMGPREEATTNAELLADLVPCKTAVCLHQTGRKGGLGPAFPTACHEARRPGHRAGDNLQAMSLRDWLLPWLFAKTHVPTP